MVRLFHFLFSLPDPTSFASRFSSFPSMASNDSLSSNPLLQYFEFPPFDSVDARHVRPGICAMLHQLEAELEKLENSVEPSWPKLVDPLEKIIDRLFVVWGIVNYLKAVKETPSFVPPLKKFSGLTAQTGFYSQPAAYRTYKT